MNNSANFNVNGFLGFLKQNQPVARGEGAPKERKLEKIYLSFPDNYGRYQIFPMNNSVTNFPFVALPKTREIKIPRKNILPDGTENVFQPWIKLLPKDAYVMYDEGSGRLVSSLTADDENLLNQAYQLFDQLYKLLGGDSKENNNDPNVNKTIGFMRRRNYTLFHGKCLNKWSTKDPRNPERSNFAALFVCSASGFLQAIDENIADGRISHGGSDDWISQIYNRDCENRSGYLIFSIALGVAGKVGYKITVSHESDKGDYLKEYAITPEEAELMRDPVADFLGWQAQYGDPVHLFNRTLMQETIQFLTQQISAVQMALTTGGNVLDAIKFTSDASLNTAAPIAANVQENTPQQVAFSAQPQAQPMADPYASPAHINPLDQTPQVNPAAQPAGAPYSAPQFAQSQFGANPTTPGSAAPNPFMH